VLSLAGGGLLLWLAVGHTTRPGTFWLLGATFVCVGVFFGYASLRGRSIIGPKTPTQHGLSGRGDR
jgi:hypothetical protein